MSTLPSTMSEGPIKVLRAVNSYKWVLLKNGVAALVGATLLVAAVWVWIAPIATGDIFMSLIKMVFSFSLFSLGYISINMMESVECIPAFQLDPVRRCLSVTEMCKRGKAKHTTHYLLDELSEISIRDSLLIARDLTGRQIATVKVTDPKVEKAIRQALAF